MRPPEPQNYVLRLNFARAPNTRKEFVVVGIRLFAEFGAPEYLVVAGERAPQGGILGRDGAQ
jgi:hypothetical protein